MERPQQIQQMQPRGVPPQKGTSTTQILTLITLLPVGASLLGLAGVTLVGTLLGAAVATPLFLLCSPVLVPAAVAVAAAVTGILLSGVLALTGLSSFSWVLNSFRQATGREPLEYARRRVQEAAIQAGEKTKQMGEMLGEKTKQVGETAKSKGQETATRA